MTPARSPRWMPDHAAAPAASAARITGQAGMSQVSPVTKAARHAQIAGILEQAAVRSQDELADWLARRGVRVTQTTLSRDLEELGAVRLRGPDGALFYALPGVPGGPGSHPGGLTESMPGRGGGSGGADGGGRVSEPGAAAGSAAAGLPGQAGRTGPEHGGLAAEPRARLARAAAELLVAAEASANLVILRTPAGAAQFLASVLDHASWPSILGTVAGDDTVLVIARDPAGGEELAQALLRLAERRG
jgi:transcriptional regulator of arginine metabolism